jgi:hypothetical protein
LHKNSQALQVALTLPILFQSINHMGKAEDSTLRLKIMEICTETKRELTNGWTITATLGEFMQRCLVNQLHDGDTWIEEVQLEVEEFLDAISQLVELTPVLGIGDSLMGASGQLFRITGRRFYPVDKLINYHFAYVFDQEDEPEYYDDIVNKDE